MSERLTEAELDEVTAAARTAQEYMQLVELYPAWVLSMVEELAQRRGHMRRGIEPGRPTGGEA